MDYTNVEVRLTAIVEGGISSRGEYEFKQEVNGAGHKVFGFHRLPKGDMDKYPVGQLVTKKAPKYNKCTYGVTLNSIFVNWAISEDSRPRSRQFSAKQWQNQSKANRLKFHIAKYVKDQFGEVDFTYEIID